MKNFGENIGYGMPAGVVSVLDLTSAGVETWFDRSTGRAYGAVFGIAFNGVNAEELAAALTEVNRNSETQVWSRFTIRKALPQADKNLLMQKLHGFRLW